MDPGARAAPLVAWLRLAALSLPPEPDAPLPADAAAIAGVADGG